MTDKTMCTSIGHSNVPATGEAQVTDDDPTRYPYCTECLSVIDPPIYWYGSAPAAWDPDGLSTEWEQDLVHAVEESLLRNDRRVRELHHARVRLDANARRLIAEIAVAALLRAQQEGSGE
jgi:hypothetical protein